MSSSIATFLTFLFWLSLIGVIARAIDLIQDHPRKPKPVNIGMDCLSMISALVVFAWICLLKFGSA